MFEGTRSRSNGLVSPPQHQSLSNAQQSSNTHSDAPHSSNQNQQRFNIAFVSHQGRSFANAITQRGHSSHTENNNSSTSDNNSNQSYALNLFSALFSANQDGQSQHQPSMMLGFAVNSSKNQHANRKLNFEMQMAGGYGDMKFSMSFGAGNKRGENTSSAGSQNTTQPQSNAQSQSKNNNNGMSISFGHQNGMTAISFSAGYDKNAGQKFTTSRDRSNAFSASNNKGSSIGNISSASSQKGIQANIGGMQLDTNNKFKSAMSILKNGRSAMKALKGLSA